MISSQKYSRLSCFLCVNGLVFCFYLGWSGSIPQFRQIIIKVGAKSWLLTCSSNIILSLLSYTGSDLKRGLNFWLYLTLSTRGADYAHHSNMGLVWLKFAVASLQNIIKVGSKSLLLTCSSNITLSLPSYTGSALNRELKFCNDYLSLLYFWVLPLNANGIFWGNTVD